MGREERVRVNAWLVGADGSVVIGVDSGTDFGIQSLKKKKEQLCVLRGPRSRGTSRETPWPI